MPAVISNWSAVSPFGIGAKSFREGIFEGIDAVGPVDPELAPADLAGRAALVPDFDIRALLGRKGTRSMDRVSGLAVVCAGDLLSASRAVSEPVSDERMGMVLGTTTGSVKSMMDITRDTWRQQKPFYIDAGSIPNAIMNSAAAQCAIWHSLRGPNVTVAGGRVAGVAALRYAMRLLSSGRADAVLAGGSEEYTPERASLVHHAADRAGLAPLGEGCGLAAVTTPEGAHETRADLLAARTCVVARGQTPARTIGALVRRSLDEAGLDPRELDWVLASNPVTEAAELSEIGKHLDGHAPRPLEANGWGDAGAAHAMFGLFAVLARAEQDPTMAGRVVAVLAADRDGMVGCILLRPVAAA